MKTFLRSGLLAVLLTIALVTAVFAVSVNWGAVNPNPIYDETGVGGTVLANGDLVQLIWDQNDNGIAPPNGVGSPTGDDQLLATSAIGVGSFFPGTFAANVNSNLIGVGDKIYVRAWNSNTIAGATRYGESRIETVTDNVSFTFDATATGSFATLTSFVPTAVTLASFETRCIDDSIMIEWETVMEINTAGFNLWRSEIVSDPPTMINAELIPAQHPGGSMGAAYEFADNSTSPSETYYYWLEEVETTGTSNMYGPITGSCTVPTAVRLNEMTAETEHIPYPDVFGAVLLSTLGVVGAAYLIRHRRKSSRSVV